MSDPLLRRINNVLARGSLEKITDDLTPTAKVELMSNEVYDGLEFPQTWGFISRPPKGAELIALFFGGNRDHGSILGIFNKKSSPSEMVDGDVMLYNDSNSYVKINAGGDIVIAACKDPGDTQDSLKRDIHTYQSQVKLKKDGTIEVDVFDNILINAKSGASVVASLKIAHDGKITMVANDSLNITAPVTNITGDVNIVGNMTVGLVNGTPIPDVD